MNKSPGSIATPRLVLQRPEVKDANAVAALMSPDLSQWLASWPGRVDAAYAARRIVDAQEAIDKGQGLHWLVRSRASAQVMGWLRVTRSKDDRTRGELGFWIGKTFQGAGYATEAARAVLPVAFERLGLTAVEGGAQLSNDSSVRVMRRLGMAPIGEREVWAEVRQRFERCVYYEINRPALSEDAKELDDLVARFLACSLPHSEWTHQAHLAVGAWHVAHFGPDEALARLRLGIRQLNDSHGTPNSATRGYHETVTRAYVLLLTEFLDSVPPTMPLAERVAQLCASGLADKEALLRCYSRSRLMSSEARATWIEPDLLPLHLTNVSK